MYLEEFTNKTSLYKAKTFGTTQIMFKVGFQIFRRMYNDTIVPTYGVNKPSVVKQKKIYLIH